MGPSNAVQLWQNLVTSIDLFDTITGDVLASNSEIFASEHCVISHFRGRTLKVLVRARQV
jgi:hypothetical protein